MASVFSKIIAGELPAHFVWKDDVCVAFLSIAPLRPGHVLVVPRAEVDHWLDAHSELLGDLMATARAVGEALQAVYQPAKVGMMIAGLEVPHLHVHLVPMNGVRDLDFANADPNFGDERLAEEAERIRDALHSLGHQPSQA